MFKENDYIVTVTINRSGLFDTSCAKENYCFKQRVNSACLSPDIDLEGSSTNSNCGLKFNSGDRLTDWRYATPQEIEEYDRLGKPFDVTLIKPINATNYEIY
jgi:hypothetical protein